MATKDEVKAWFNELDADEKKTVKETEAAVKQVKDMLVQAQLIEPTASDGQVIDTLKMRHD